MDSNLQVPTGASCLRAQMAPHAGLWAVSFVGRTTRSTPSLLESFLNLNVELLLEPSHVSSLFLLLRGSCVKGAPLSLRGNNNLTGSRVLKSCSPPSRCSVCPSPVSWPGPLLCRPRCRFCAFAAWMPGEERGKAGMGDGFGHCSLCNYDRSPALGVSLIFRLFYLPTDRHFGSRAPLSLEGGGTVGFIARGTINASHPSLALYSLRRCVREYFCLMPTPQLGGGKV